MNPSQNQNLLRRNVHKSVRYLSLCFLISAWGYKPQRCAHACEYSLYNSILKRGHQSRDRDQRIGTRRSKSKGTRLEIHLFAICCISIRIQVPATRSCLQIFAAQFRFEAQASVKSWRPAGRIATNKSGGTRLDNTPLCVFLYQHGDTSPSHAPMLC